MQLSQSDVTITVRCNYNNLNIMNDIGNVSQQAFLEELHNWELTLAREAKKLKQLRKVVTNKLQINTIDITLINIESELIQYKKIREKKVSHQYGVIELYTALSKRFMNIMEKIGESAENQRYRDNNFEEELTTEENTCPNNKQKHFLEETFSHKISKHPPNTKNKSLVENRKQVNETLKEKGRSKAGSKPARSSENSRRKIMSQYTNLNRLQLEEQQDLSDVRYQLKEIKSLMSQMQKEIKLHNHEEVDREVSKLSQNNKRLALDIKSVKEDSQFVIARLQHLKDELNHEKNMQAEMIRKLENARESRVQVHSLSRDNKQTDDVSEWVKIRI